MSDTTGLIHETTNHLKLWETALVQALKECDPFELQDPNHECKITEG